MGAVPMSVQYHMILPRWYSLLSHPELPPRWSLSRVVLYRASDSRAEAPFCIPATRCGSCSASPHSVNILSILKAFSWTEVGRAYLSRAASVP